MKGEGGGGEGLAMVVGAAAKTRPVVDPAVGGSADKPNLCGVK